MKVVCDKHLILDLNLQVILVDAPSIHEYQESLRIDEESQVFVSLALSSQRFSGNAEIMEIFTVESSNH